MRVLFDQGTPVPLREFLADHEVFTAYELNWSNLTNGDLLLRAEANGFEVLISTDQNLRYQQKLAGRMIAIVVLSSTSWPRIRRVVHRVAEALAGIGTNGYVEVTVPYGDQNVEL